LYNGQHEKDSYDGKKEKIIELIHLSFLGRKFFFTYLPQQAPHNYQKNLFG
jgi:hypothetical protein